VVHDLVDPVAEGLDRASLCAGVGVTDATASCTIFLICDMHDQGGGRGVENVGGAVLGMMLSWASKKVMSQQASTELLGAPIVLLAMTSLLTDSQMKIECNGRQHTIIT
jgi:hypothetical protein